MVRVVGRDKLVAPRAKRDARRVLPRVPLALRACTQAQSFPLERMPGCRCAGAMSWLCS